MAVEITDKNFQEIINNPEGLPVMVDFWAAWCGPCLAIGPIVEELSNEYAGKAIVGKVDVDTNPEVSSKFGVRNIPTILFFKNGELADKQVGATSKAEFAKKLQNQMVVA